MVSVTEEVNYWGKIPARYLLSRDETSEDIFTTAKFLHKQDITEMDKIL